MYSTTKKKQAEEERQEALRQQIAALQAQLKDGGGSDRPPSPKRTSGILVPETPSKKRKREEQAAKKPAAYLSRTLSAGPPTFPLKKPKKEQPSLAPPAESTLLKKLAEAHKQRNQPEASEPVARSADFTAAPPTPAPPQPGSNIRDENLALVEDLQMGPFDHKPPFDDPHFERLEPNSNIRLSSRAIPHADFQDYLRGRYYLSPSKLYSVVRLLPNKAGYDVPIDGDWLTIAVVAERGPMRYTQAPVAVTRDDDVSRPGNDDERMDALPSLNASAQPGPSRPAPFQRRPKAEGAKPSRGKKYVNLRLIDFGCRSRGGGVDGGTAKIRGDAYLSLLLFEADGADDVVTESGAKRKVYRGGSRGAFERMAKLREGAVVALLNPRVLRPFQRAADRPHPTENVLALTPESDAGVAVVGYAQDLGMCKAVKRDGKRCEAWCDKRVSDVCDFHVQAAVERSRAARPEFAIGTGGMSSSAVRKKPVYDPARQWGLKPEPGRGATYMVSGHVVSGSTADPGEMFIGESVGREAQARAARKLAAKDGDVALKRLLARDKEGTRALASAREFAKAQAEEAGKGNGKKSARANSEDEESEDDKTMRKSGYSAELIKQLGFDPTSRGGKPTTDANTQSKLGTLAALNSARKIELGPRPGKKRSCVQKPLHPSADKPRVDSGMVILDSDSDDEVEREEIKAFGRPMGLLGEEEDMVDLDQE
ncbi:uncharacterized protein BXZ73DRAFT_105735 [Epithele typhae]|uniref:uncharacterized protein n=1 Tax=Epithele typhae TaxID=378194 RepID=UPI002007FDDD|nr:uncharacterized protein BXZ73DRAFT_105735 [Epithele typhae]KAH9916757.1 hypothetical protein BXZ73DRAFT_105735 [Epithele typhae]